MANSKISALPSATTPLAGTETLPIVQSSTTKQVSVANLTTGRAISASSLSLTTPLTVGNGGTGTSTAFTLGSVIFAGASGVYSQNNAGLFFDNTNSYLGIAANSPIARLQLGSGLSGSNATHVGTIQINEATTSLANTGGLEWKTSAFGSGYGWKISSIDSSGVQLVIGTRQNSAAWTEVARFDSNNDFKLNTGNLIQGTAAKGINFTANTPAAGMTSQLLNWYEEGTWTPTVTPATGSFTTVTAGTCSYTRTGRVVTVNARFTLTNSGTGAGAMTIAGLPFTISSTYDQTTFTGRIVNTGTPIFGQLVGTTTTMDSFQTIAGLTAITNGYIYTLTATYTV